MENKQLGVIILILTVFLGLFIFSLQERLSNTTEDYCSCTTNACPHQKDNNINYLGIGLLTGLVSLSAYLIFFDKTNKEIVKRLDEHRTKLDDEEKFKIFLKGLSVEEKKIVTAIKEQDGITQNTLSLRTDLHKSKLSILIAELEKKNIVKRMNHKRTKKVYLKIAL